jgi:hypothetical protein
MSDLSEPVFSSTNHQRSSSVRSRPTITPALPPAVPVLAPTTALAHSPFRPFSEINARDSGTASQNRQLSTNRMNAQSSRSSSGKSRDRIGGAKKMPRSGNIFASGAMAGVRPQASVWSIVILPFTVSLQMS